MNKLRLQRKLQQFQNRKLSIMRAIANNSVNFFKIQTFNAQGWIDHGIERWPERKSKKDDAGRKILVKTGTGRQSIHVFSVSIEKAVIKVEAEYMRYHNEGTNKLPKRKFMGESATLDRQNIFIIRQKLRGLL